MFYAAQVWGYKKYDEVEKLLRFFIKKLLYLHKTTPNYMLYLETGLDSLFLSTLKLNFNYIQKVLQMNPNRLPYKLAFYVIDHKIHWASEWNNILHQIQGTVNNISFLNISWENIAEKISFTERAVNIAKAKASQHHDPYPKLEFNVIPTLINNFKSWPTS